MCENQHTLIKTEDGQFLMVGDRAYNYYDQQPGIIDLIHTVYNNGENPNKDIWFDFQHNDGSKTLLNGQRICSMKFAQQRDFKGANPGKPLPNPDWQDQV